MTIQEISISGFGVLSDLTLRGLRPGLNVVHGRNGSGKTTLLHFLRGIFCGYEEARRLRLLPPLRDGLPGGSVALESAGARCEVIRRFRAGHLDTLAIRLLHGPREAVVELRQQFNRLDRDLISAGFAVTGPQSHSLDPLVRLALREGIPLQSEPQQTHWLQARIREIEAERADLFHGAPSRGAIVELEQRSQELSAAVNQARQTQAEREERWYLEMQQTRDELNRLERRAEWLDAERQAVEADLVEVETRLWAPLPLADTPAGRAARDGSNAAHQRTIHISSEQAWSAGHFRADEIRQIDAEIAHAQQVLRDLAGSRWKLSLARAGLVGSETPDPPAALERQRSALRAMNRQTERLVDRLADLADANQQQSCICRELRTDLSETLRSLRQQAALLCQELGRQQSAHEQSLIVSERDGIDRCELELTRQIQRLRLRREELLDRSAQPVVDRIRLRTVHESAGCRCDQHEPFPQPASPAADVFPEIPSPSHLDPQSRLRDQQQQQALAARKRELQQQWLDACRRLNDLRTRMQQLVQFSAEFAHDRSVQEIRHEYSVVEQQLADAREQWESLAVLQLVLQKTQQQLQVEAVPAVIEEASRLLGELTEGRYRGFRFAESTQELYVVSDAGAVLPLQALSRGTHDQAALSFRLALWSEFGRRGLRLPLILDDVLTDSDERRLHVAANILATLPGDRQLIFFTCQEHLANLFETLGANVQDLPGSVRTRRAEELNPPMAISSEMQTLRAEGVSPPLAVRDRVQPDEPYWLQTHHPASSVPSLGEQMARRLGALGVREVADLIELDPEQTEIPLESLQISASMLRVWQAEARLLVCVPDLTGRDAQLLAAVGIHHPAELAQIEFLELSRRIQRWRSRTSGDFAFPWLAEHPEWPSAEAVQRWIRCGRSARTYRQARDWSVQRRLRNRQQSLPQPSEATARSGHVVGAPHFSDSPLAADPAASAVVEPPATVRLYPSTEAVTTERKFYLHLDSPIVDAPSIGPTTAERLEKIGIMAVSHLVTRDATEIATRLNRQRITVETVTAWQQQAWLVCRIPELRGHDAQVLVACGITTAEEVARYSPGELFRIVGPFVSSKEGQRLLRSAKTPDLEEVAGWIECARHSRSLRAA